MENKITVGQVREKWSEFIFALALFFGERTVSGITNDTKNDNIPECQGKQDYIIAERYIMQKRGVTVDRK